MGIQGPYFERGSPIWIHYQVSPMIGCHGLTVVVACLWGGTLDVASLPRLTETL